MVTYENPDRIFDPVFEKIYVINLPYRTDRRRQIEVELKKVNLSLQDEDVLLLPATRPAEKGKWPSIGARGCFESHLAVLKDAHQKNFESILILEDDADWSEAFLRNPHEVIRNLQNQNWDMLHGGFKSSANAQEFRVLSSNEEVILAHFVAFKRSVLPSIVAFLEELMEREAGHKLGGPMHIDGAYNWFRRTHKEFSTVISEPFLAQQRSSRTDIHELKWSDKMPLISQIKNGIRPIYYKLRKRFK